MKYYYIFPLFLISTALLGQQKKIDIIIRDTGISSPLDYSHLTIKSLKIPPFVNFHNAVSFDNDTLLKEADFSSSTFLKDADWSFVKFADFVNFSDVMFSKNTTIWYSIFSQNVTFKGAAFSNVRFNGTTFSKSADFTQAHFKHNAVLSLSNLNLQDNNSNLTFVDTILPDTILFSENNNIKQDIYFTAANFTDSCRYNYAKKKPNPILIFLYNSNISRLHLDYVHFKLLLPDFAIKFGGMEKTIISYDEKAAIYEALLNNFKTNGQIESYKLLDVEYQQFKWNNSWASRIFCLPKYWSNFGYDKEYIFIWTFGSLILFTVITYFFIHNLNTKVYPIRKIPVYESWRKKWSLKDFGNRSWYSFMYTSAVFFTISLEIKNLEFKEKTGTVYLIVIYTIGLVCIAYMANFVLQKTIP
jgi:hypothetical protein